MTNGKQNEAKEQYWIGVVEDFGRSGQAIREYCRDHGVNESQFYWWRRKLQGRGNGRRSASGPDRSRDDGARFALVIPEAVVPEGGIELVLTDGRKVRIGRGVDEQTLRTVLAVVESRGC
jgi:transposase-like protein